MLDIFPQPEKWDLLNNSIKKQLKSDHLVRSYINPYLATYDLIIGLSQLFAHKRSIAWIKGLSPFFDSVYPHFVREGYQIQTFTLDQYKEAQKDIRQFVEGLKKDTLFFVYFEDHPLTGETYDYEELENALSHKKIFSISVSHHSFFYQPKSFYPLSARICWYDKNMTLVYLGEKFKVNSVLGYYQNLGINMDSTVEKEQLESKIASFQSKKFFQNEIIDFESEFRQNIFINTSNRVWDRSILKFTEVHTDELAFRLNELGYKNIFSLSSCATASVKMFQKWLVPELPKDQLQNLIYFSFETKDDFPKPAEIKKLIADIVADSQWEF